MGKLHILNYDKNFMLGCVVVGGNLCFFVVAERMKNMKIISKKNGKSLKTLLMMGKR